jgi:hypothetical protein
MRWGDGLRRRPTGGTRPIDVGRQHVKRFLALLAVAGTLGLTGTGAHAQYPAPPGPGSYEFERPAPPVQRPAPAVQRPAHSRQPAANPRGPRNSRPVAPRPTGPRSTLNALSPPQDRLASLPPSEAEFHEELTKWRGVLDFHFRVNPTFVYVEGANAEAAPPGPGTNRWGQIKLGKDLVRKEFGQTGPVNWSLVVVLGHEYAHILQNASGCPLVGKPRELMADHMAGWFSKITQDLPDGGISADQGAASLMAHGDHNVGRPDHHGTPEERRAAYYAGFSGSSSNIQQAYQAAMNYVSGADSNVNPETGSGSPDPRRVPSHPAPGPGSGGPPEVFPYIYRYDPRTGREEVFPYDPRRVP